MVSNAALVKIAGYGALGIASFGYFEHHYTQRKLRLTPSYKEALGIIRGHRKASQYLGEPIKEGKIVLSTPDDGVQPFTVLLRGSNTKGKIYCEVIPNKDPTKRSELNRIEITFDNIPDKIFTIFERTNIPQ